MKGELAPTHQHLTSLVYLLALFIHPLTLYTFSATQTTVTIRHHVPYIQLRSSHVDLVYLYVQASPQYCTAIIVHDLI
jgi:hypothetical protein